MTDEPPRGRHLLRALGSDADGQDTLLATLRRRRRLRVGLVQLGYLTIAVALGVTLPAIARGPTVPRAAVTPLLVGIAGGLISFIALVFSLLFLVIQSGNATFSPRFTLFRDAPMVWHSFGYFAAVLVFSATAAVRIGTAHDDVSVVVPITAMVMLLVALALSRALQMNALRSLQFNDSMEAIRRHGEAVLTTLYHKPFTGDPPSAVTLPPVATELRWEAATTTLTQIDLPRLIAHAERLDAVIEVKVMIGTELRRGQVVAVLHASEPVDANVFGAFMTGLDRTFTQDPLFAFRLLADIGDRALSTAVNDPETAAQALGCMYDLLALIVDKQLSFGVIADRQGVPRVRLRLPTWDDFVAESLDEVVFYSGTAPTVRRRLDTLVRELMELAPPERRPALSARLAP